MNNMRLLLLPCVLVSAIAVAASGPMTVTDTYGDVITLVAGHESLQKWVLPDQPKHPKNNKPTPERVDLGKSLFFDPRLSGTGAMSCASCHSPMFGWSDGLATASGDSDLVLGRASPTVFNTAFNPLQMWDGRKRTLEAQAMGPMLASVEMNIAPAVLFERLRSIPGYRDMFEKAYPGEPINDMTLSKAIANFERTIISNNSPFDHWIKGDADALNDDEIAGFALFIDPDKGNCSACHDGANFTNSSFHNLGLASFGEENPDVGRYAQLPLKSMYGAFKTPTVREAANTAPYFHDGSAKDLTELVRFYMTGGIVKTSISPDLRPLNLSDKEVSQLVAFMESLSSPSEPFAMPVLPK